MRGAWNLNNKELLGPGFRREEGRIHVMVVIPPQVAPQDTLPSAEGIPAFTPLDNWKKYMMECSLDRWKAGQVRNIPSIYGAAGWMLEEEKDLLERGRQASIVDPFGSIL
ncbi:hypothetical protein P3T76_002266 [Phytophthora citrophthora]|uniref:Uncharacterized protein n=1 Tax=Phytophthora citrophthora TaxID=4793 RepID=A0AAD9GY31_9STRA|nr:hypothetical protein P3T76_002266 [Phytophthora citrophthora]